MTPLTASREAYRRNTVLSATREQLVVMLYDGAGRFLRQAATAMQAGEVELAHNTLRRAEMIIAHLDTVLDYDQGGQLAQRLHSIYRFCLTHLNKARMEQDPRKLEEVGELLGELRSSWAEIANG
jgi:flagellar secretion chaperone FliS